MSPWWRGAVVIAAASETVCRPGFESRQGVRFFGRSKVKLLYVFDLISIVFVLKKRNKGIGPKIKNKIKYDAKYANFGLKIYHLATLYENCGQTGEAHYF
jgi:hypothetical protein